MERFARDQALAALRQLPKSPLSDAATMQLADEAKHATRTVTRAKKETAARRAPRR